MLRKLNTYVASAAIIGLMLSTPAAAEKTVEDFQSWGMITATGNFSTTSRFKWWMEGHGRFGDNSSRSDHLTK